MSKHGEQTPSPTPGQPQRPADPDTDLTLPEGAFDKTLPEGLAAPASDDSTTMVGDEPAPNIPDGATMVAADPATSDSDDSDYDYCKTPPDGVLAQLEDDDFAGKTIMMDDVAQSGERTLPDELFDKTLPDDAIDEHVDKTMVADDSEDAEDQDEPSDDSATMVGDEPAPSHSDDDYSKTPPDGVLAQPDDDDFAGKTIMMDDVAINTEGTLPEQSFDQTLTEGALDAPSSVNADQTMVLDSTGDGNEADDFGKTIQVDSFGKTMADDGTIVPEEDFDGKTIVGADSAVENVAPPAGVTVATPSVQRSGDTFLSSRATRTGGKTSIEGTQVGSAEMGDGIAKESLNVARRSISGLQYGAVPRVDFKLVKVLGEGGMGVVYVAKQQSLGREVVFKTLKPMPSAQSDKLRASGTFNSVIKHRTDMFLSEAVVTADLFHPNIVPIYELAEAPDGSLFYTMKWVRGTGWNKCLKDMTLEDNLAALMKVSDAIAFAHSRHIVNRDLKPENVMLGEYGETIVLDWGLALPFGEGKHRLPLATTAGLGSGTPAYMPPELITGPLGKIGPACDIYLLGAMLFEVVTGLPPHDFSSQASGATLSAGAKMAQIRRVVVDNVIRETEHTGELIDIAKKAMATKREDRHRSVVEFQNAIRDYQKHAASRTLVDRAKEMTVVTTPVITETKPTADAPTIGYSNFQNALALYNESLREWPGNHDARAGLTDTQLHFAKLALTKGDFDLGLSVLDTNADSHSETRTLLLKAREDREGRVRVMKLLKWTAVGLLIGFAGVSAYAAKGQFDLNAVRVEKQKAEDDTAKALIATKKAKDDQKVANAARKLADEKKVEAEKEAADAKIAQKMADEAREIADKAKEKADAAAIVANKAKDEAEADAAIADKAKKKAEVDAKLAKIAKEKAEEEGARANYLKGLAVANRFIQEGNYPAAKTQLNFLKNNFKDRCKEEWEQLWNTVTAPQAVSLSKPVESLGLSLDGSKLVAGDSAGHIVVWPLDADGKIVFKPLGEFELGTRLRAVAISPDGSQVAAAGEGPKGANEEAANIHIWKLTGVAAQRPAAVLKGHLAAINALKFSADGRRLVSGSDDRTVRLWSVADAKELATTTVLYSVRCVDWSRNSQLLVAGTSSPEESSGVAYSWKVQTDDSVITLEKLRTFQVPPEGKGTPGGLVKQDRGVLAIALTDDGKFAVSNGPASELHLWQIDIGKSTTASKVYDAAIKLGEHSRRVERVRSLAFSKDNAHLLAAGDDGTITIWTREAGNALPLNYVRKQVIVGHGGPVRSCLPLPGSPDLLVSGSYDQNVHRWDVKTYLATRKWLDQPDTDAPPAALRSSELDVSISDSPKVGSPFVGMDFKFAECEPLAPSNRLEFAIASFQPSDQEPQQKIATQNEAKPSDEKPVPGTPRKSVQLAGRDKKSGERIGHADSVLSAVFSRDGKRVLSASRDQTARVWNSETGLPIDTVTGEPAVLDASGEGDEKDRNVFQEGHDYDLFTMRFFPDGKQLLTSGFDGEMRIWDARIDMENSFGRELAVLPKTGVYGVVEISRDGEWILTAGKENSAQLWNMQKALASRRPRPVLELNKSVDQSHKKEKTDKAIAEYVHHYRVTSVAISPDNSRLLTADREGLIVFWDATSGKIVGRKRGAHSGEVVKAEFLGNGSQLLTAGVDGRVVLWNVVDSDSGISLQVVRQFKQDGMIVNLAVNPQGDRFISVIRRGEKKNKKDADPQEAKTKVSLFEIDTGKEQIIDLIGTANQPADSARAPFPAWAKNGILAIITTPEGIIHFYDSDARRVTRSLEVEKTKDKAGRIQPNATSRAQPYAAILRPDELKPLHVITQTHNAAYLWRLEDNGGENLVSFRPQGAVFSASYSSDGSFVVTGGRSVRIFDGDERHITAYGRPLHKIEHPHEGIVTSVEFSPDKKSHRFLTTGYDGLAKIWEWNPGRKVATLIEPPLKGHKDAVRFGTWSPDGLRVLTVGDDAKPRIWSFPEGKEPQSVVLNLPEGQNDPPDESDRNFDMLCGAFSWDGRFVAVGGRDAETGESIGWIWNLGPNDGASRVLHATIRGHGLGGINSVAFLPDDDRLLTGGADGTARMWDWQKQAAAENNGAAVEADFLISLLRPRPPNEKQATTHRGAVTSVRVTRAGKIVTASADGTVLIWPK